jgi:hypothetical protein
MGQKYTAHLTPYSTWEIRRAGHMLCSGMTEEDAIRLAALLNAIWAWDDE